MANPIPLALLLLLQSADAVSDEDRSGPTRAARCLLDDEPIRRCWFTPLFGDGSFHIELDPDRQFRLVVNGEIGHFFTSIDRDRHVRSFGPVYRRERQDRACWAAPAAADGSGRPRRICVYR